MKEKLIKLKNLLYYVDKSSYNLSDRLELVLRQLSLESNSLTIILGREQLPPPSFLNANLFEAIFYKQDEYISLQASEGKTYDGYNSRYIKPKFFNLPLDASEEVLDEVIKTVETEAYKKASARYIEIEEEKLKNKIASFMTEEIEKRRELMETTVKINVEALNKTN